MILDGDESVLDAIKDKKCLMDAGEEHGHLKILCICDGGLMKGAYSVGTGLALEELGYVDVFSDLVGVSSGAPSVAYFLGRNVKVGGSLIYEECCSKKFMNRWRFWNPANLDYLIDVLRGATGKAIKAEQIFNSATKLHIGVSNYHTAEPILVTPTDEDSLLKAIKASALMPNVSADAVYIDNVRYVDGGFALPHILDKVLTSINFTHVLVLTNQNYGEENVNWLETFVSATIFRKRISKPVRKAMAHRRESRRAALDGLKERDDVKSLVVWGDGSLDGSEQDPVLIKEVVERSRLWWRELLS